MPFQFSGQSLPVKMVSLRLPLSWLIILFCGLVYVNCELEEYFKWKQITFASVEKGKITHNFTLFILNLSLHSNIGKRLSVITPILLHSIM